MKLRAPGVRLRHALSIAAVLLAATALSLGASALGVGRESVSMIYLLGVLMVTVLTGNYVSGIAAAFISFMLLNFFFTSPTYTFVISQSADLITLLFFLITAMISGTVMSLLKRQRELAQNNEKTTRLLYEFAGGFMHLNGEGNIIRRGMNYIHRHTGLTSAVRLNNGAAYGTDEPAGESITADFQIPGVSRSLGSLKVQTRTAGLTAERELVLKTVATLMGTALEREIIYSEREKIRIAMEREKMRSTFLRSIAHDLRTPLTALAGSGTLLYEHYDTLTEQQRRGLALSMSEEITWLMNLVENILNMTRINEDKLIIAKEDEVVDDVVGEALRHMASLIHSRPVQVKLPDEIVTAPMDGKLIVQVIVNLLDNAVRHTPDGSPISLVISPEKDQVVFEVADSGQGIDPSLIENVFDSFIRGTQPVSDGKRGIGLGLAICKAVIQAHGGMIWAENLARGGAKITFTLPREEGPCVGTIRESL